MCEMTGGELLLKCLKEEGVTVLFGVLDGTFNPFLAKLDEYGMRFINPRHEAAAAHMAEAWARILDTTETPAVPRAAYYVDYANRVVELAPLTLDAETLLAAADQVADLPITNSGGVPSTPTKRLPHSATRSGCWTEGPPWSGFRRAST